MQKRQINLAGGALLLAIVACAPVPESPPAAEEPPALPPEPVVTYRGSENDQGRVEHTGSSSSMSMKRGGHCTLSTTLTA